MLHFTTGCKRFDRRHYYMAAIQMTSTWDHYAKMLYVSTHGRKKCLPRWDDSLAYFQILGPGISLDELYLLDVDGDIFCGKYFSDC